MLQFRILGVVQMVRDGQICAPTAPKVSSVLALLLARANHVVDINSLIAELWGTKPPRSAVATAQTYIYHLRRKFDSEEPDSGEELLQTSAPGYLLRVSDEQVDAQMFERLAREGRAKLDQGRIPEGARLLREALGLWQGTPMANVPAGRLLEAHIVHLEETRLRTLELRIQADSALGRHRELIPELRSLVATYPLNEWLHAQLIDALHRAGRRGDALTAYQQCRAVLDDELGLPPSAELQRLQHEVLTGDSEPPASGPGPLAGSRRELSFGTGVGQLVSAYR
jgi:SARP family transcriptional regulator, regulator of embCAB operon